ncbi:MAG: Ig-like domain-containing protein, partial [Gemmatimonadaceae bacterium]
MAALTIVTGNGQSGFVGQTLGAPLVVKVTSAAGTPFKGAVVKFTVTSGTATLSPATATSDSLGEATTTVTLGSLPGNVTITASTANNSLTVSFTVTAGSSNVTTACQRLGAQTPAVGVVLPRVTGTGICLGGGSNTVSAEYALVAFYGDPDSSKIASMSVT